MESLFTRSPHSITAFTRSQLTSFPTTGYSIPFSPCFFFFFFFCPHKRTFWLHSSTFLTFPSPPTAPLQTHINVHSDHTGTLRTHGHIDTEGHTHQYSKLSRVWHITTKAHISKSQSLSFFISALFATIETDWKAQREGGGGLLQQSAVTSRSVTARYTPALSFKVCEECVKAVRS